jgi:serine/threonine-protein kinase
MCAGELPFRGEGNMDVMAAIMRDAHRPLRERNPDVPEALAAVVDKCLAKSPEARYPSAREVAEALEGIAITGDASVPAALAAAPSTKSLGASVVSGDDLRRRQWRTFFIAAAVLIAGSALVIWTARSHGDAALPAASAAASAAPDGATRGIAITDLPPPKTSNPEAAKEFALARQAMRDAAGSAANLHLRRALELDPQCAAIHLYVAVAAGSNPDEVNKELAIAAELRADLDDRDRAVLEQFQALMAKGGRATEDTWQRAKAFVARFPLDAEAANGAAKAALYVGHEAEGLALSDRSMELDPQFAGAVAQLAQYRLETGNLEAAAAAADRCLAISSSASDCRAVRAQVDQRLGQCAKLEEEARAMIAADPRAARAYSWLASALEARGAPVEAVVEAFRHSREINPDPKNRELQEMVHPIAAAWVTGDFASGMSTFPRLEEWAAKQTSDALVMEAYISEVNMYTEVGQPDRALAVSEAYMKRLPALTRGSPEQHRQLVLRELRRANRMSDAEFHAMRDSWMKDAMSRMPPTLANNLWFMFYGEPALTPGDAREALDALAQFQPMPPYDGIVYNERVMGQVLLLAGRVDEAIPHLRRAITACFNPQYIPSHQWSAEMLGEALESKGDKPGACEAYGEVLVHWGDAKPRSVTADKARAHMKSLGCSK